jgi:hypothetical protein
MCMFVRACVFAEKREWELYAAQGAPPAARLGHTATMMKGSMWVFGGYMRNMYFSDLHHLDLGTVTRQHRHTCHQCT